MRSLLDRYGPWALVTGASDGIGKAFAIQLAQSGFNLILVARRGAVLDTLAAELSQTHAIRCDVVPTDLGNQAALARMLAATPHRDIGLLVAAAGYGTSGPFLANAIDAELDMIDVNCRSVVGLTHAIGRQMAARGRGGIILLSSLVAFQGVPRAANYAATKAFIQSFAEGLRIELKPRGIDVLAVAPGPVESGFARRAAMMMGSAAPPATTARGALRALGRRTTSRPGLLAAGLEAALSMLPRRGRSRIMALAMGGMTRSSPANDKKIL